MKSDKSEIISVNLIKNKIREYHKNGSVYSPYQSFEIKEVESKNGYNIVYFYLSSDFKIAVDKLFFNSNWTELNRLGFKYQRTYL